MTGSTDISKSELIAYAAGELTGAAAAQVEAHLDGNPDAAHLVGLYRHVAACMAADDSVESPRETTERAKRIFSRHASAPNANWPERVVAVVARLIFDSRLQPMAVRFDDAGTRVQLVYETDHGEVDLVAERRTNERGVATWRVTGQYDAEHATRSIEAALCSSTSTRPETSAHGDEHGVFVLDIPPGRYELRLSIADGVIVVPGIELE